MIGTSRETYRTTLSVWKVERVGFFPIGWIEVYPHARRGQRPEVEGYSQAGPMRMVVTQFFMFAGNRQNHGYGQYAHAYHIRKAIEHASCDGQKSILASEFLHIPVI